MAKNSSPRRASTTASSPTWPASIAPSANVSAATPCVRSGPVGPEGASLMAAQGAWTALVGGAGAEVVGTIDRVHGDLAHVDSLQHAQRHVGARAAAVPHLAIELGLRPHALVADGQDDVPRVDARLVARALGRYAADDESTV